MVLNKEFSNIILSIDSDSSNHIANIFKSKLDSIIVTGFPLSDAFAYGYSKSLRVIIDMLLDSTDLKEYHISNINKLNLSCYNNYSCNACFNKGFLYGIDQLKIELNKN